MSKPEARGERKATICTHCDGTGVEPFETSAYPPEPCSVCKPISATSKELRDLNIPRTKGNWEPMKPKHQQEVGVAVKCTVCGLRKKPVGRSAPLEMASSLCDHECPGYRLEPYPGQLWPGEAQEEYGY